jgi:hypothetical protein
MDHIRFFIVLFIAFFSFRYYLKNYLTDSPSNLKDAIIISICYAVAGVFVKIVQ